MELQCGSDQKQRSLSSSGQRSVEALQLRGHARSHCVSPQLVSVRVAKKSAQIRIYGGVSQGNIQQQQQDEEENEEEKQENNNFLDQFV